MGNIGYKDLPQIGRTGALLLFLFVTAIGKAQYDAQLLENIASNYEKVFVKLDRDAYVTGGTMRYRAFLSDAGLVQSNVRSRILYFELTGPEPAGPIRWRINLDRGGASGAFEIPAALPSGVYTLKAFTNWVRNGDPDFIFSTDVLLFNISDEVTSEVAVGVHPPGQTALISFFPEGGNLVGDVPCKIGYKLNATADAPMPVLLSVKENDSTVVLQVVPDKGGFGSFIFLPETGKDYYGELTFAAGQSVRVSMPFIEPFGYTIQAEEVRDGLDVAIRGRSDNTGQRTSLHLMAESRGRILLDTVFAMTDESRMIHVPSGRLDEGILYLTLYDTRRFTLAQRLYYIEASESPGSVSISGLKTSYSRGENIRLELSLEGFSPDDTASFAVSVSEQHPFKDLISHPGIREYLLLSSEIRDLPVTGREIRDMPAGRIRDLLLLVSASDYAWDYSNKTILTDCLYEKEVNGYVLKGSIQLGATREPLADASLLIGTTDSITPRMIYARTDENGSFHTLLKPFFDNKTVILQVADDMNSSDLVWNFEDKALPRSVIQRSVYTLTDAERKYAEESRNLQLIGMVFGSATTGTVQKENHATEIIFLRPDMVVYPADFTELVNFKEIADNILPTVRFVRRNRQYSTEVFNINNEIWLPNSQVLLNGILFKDLDYIATLGSNDIAKIEVYNTNVLLGQMTLPGLIAIYTHDAEIPDTYLKNNVSVIDNNVIFNDLTEVIPAVEAATEEDDAFPDFRQTLYWAPDLKVANSETAYLEFSASQLQGNYVLDIQGISQSGAPLIRRFGFTVE